MITFSELDDKCMDVFDKMKLMESATVKLIHKSNDEDDGRITPKNNESFVNENNQQSHVNGVHDVSNKSIIYFVNS